VVLGGKHLVALAALVLVLIAGIAFLGYAALKRNQASSQTAAAPATDAPVQTAAAETQPDPQTPTATTPPATEPAPAPTTAETTPPAVPPGGGAPTPGSIPPAAGPGRATTDPATRKAKPAPKPTEPVVAAPPPVTEPPVAPTPAPTPPPPPAPEVPPLTFNDVKVLVPQGNSMRDRDAVLRLTGDRLVLLDKSGQAEILSVPYSSVLQAFFSRSKQPKWKGPDGKEAVASVDLGKMSFFRGDRNWLILTTQGAPVFIRLENSGLRTVLPAIEERVGVKIQR
jgi:hypothetical protein